MAKKSTPKKEVSKYYQSPSFLMRFVIALSMFFSGNMLYSGMPDQMPIHWNFAGQPNDWGDKLWAIWLIPGITLAMVFLFPVLSRIDPKRTNYDKFNEAWELIQTTIIVFMAYIYVMQFFMIIYPDKSTLMAPLMMTGVGVLFMVLGKVMGKIEQNYFVGLRTPWTLDNPVVWKKSQKVMGKAFIIGGAVFITNAWLQVYVQTVFIITVIAMVVTPIFYSYWISRGKN